MRTLSVFILAFITSIASPNPLPGVPHIYVEGAAEVEVEPDIMTITVGLEASDLDVAVAKKLVDERSAKLIKACKDLGIKSKEISTTALQVQPQYDYRNNERVLTGTQVSRQVDITLNDLNKYPQFMQALMNAKISRTINTALSVKNLDDLFDKAQNMAIVDARRRAQGLASALNKSVGDVHSISEFKTRTDVPYQLTSGSGLEKGFVGNADLAMMRTASQEPFEPGLIQVSAIVYVVFLLQ